MSQVSLAESSPGPGDRDLVSMVKCVSSENISRAGNTMIQLILVDDILSFLSARLSTARAVSPALRVPGELHEVAALGVTGGAGHADQSEASVQVT